MKPRVLGQTSYEMIPGWETSILILSCAPLQRCLAPRQVEYSLGVSCLINHVTASCESARLHTLAEPSGEGTSNGAPSATGIQAPNGGGGSSC